MFPTKSATARVIRVCACVAFCCTSLGAFARFNLEQVMSSPFPSELHAAEHLPRIAWVFNQQGVRNIWIADAPNFTARAITHYSTDDGQALSSIRLTPDGRTVVYVRGGETNHQGEVPNPASYVQQQHEDVWAVDVDSG